MENQLPIRVKAVLDELQIAAKEYLYAQNSYQREAIRFAVTQQRFAQARERASNLHYPMLSVMNAAMFKNAASPRQQ